MIANKKQLTIKAQFAQVPLPFCATPSRLLRRSFLLLGKAWGFVPLLLFFGAVFAARDAEFLGEAPFLLSWRPRLFFVLRLHESL